MVRTKADGGCAASRKVVAARAPRKSLGSSAAGCSSAASPKSGKAKYAGGNPVCQRPIPDWQKGIGGFLNKGKENVDSQSSSSSASNSDEIEVLELDSGAGASGSCE
ncbi:PCNA-associated factor-like [Haliotis asinina]|uniref:PCNA-associated factor-like n=1 Tax=Haliotis asinina TaxID=109174 RepID=UPI0035325620